MPGTTWTNLKKFIDQGYGFYEEALSNPSRYVLTVNPKDIEWNCVIMYTDTTDKSDYETNYQSGKSACLCDTYAGQDAHLFDTEALADGVYENTNILICHGAFKTFNIENSHATNGLKYKVWGSPNASNWEEVIGETALTAQTKVSVANNDYWKYIKISAKGDGGASEIDAYVQVGAH